MKMAESPSCDEEQHEVEELGNGEVFEVAAFGLRFGRADHDKNPFHKDN